MLVGKVPHETIQTVINIFDVTSCDYDISRKCTDMIPVTGIPEEVKWYIASKAVQNLSRGTLQQYYWKLSDLFASVSKAVKDVESADIIKYMYNFKQVHSASDNYMDNIRITLNGFFNWCKNNGYIDLNPCINIKKIHYQTKEREPLTEYELELLRWNCADVREKAIVDFLFSTGVRVSECADVQLSDINWAEHMVRIRHGKGDKERIVFFNAEAELSMRKYLETRSDSTNALFVSVKAPHNGLHKGGLEKIVSNIGKRVKIHAYPHRFRHSFGTHGIQSGMPLPQLQALMGHSKPETTMIYAKLDKTDLQREHRRCYT